jgi:peptidyl-prolyl cis-trans isomerase D
MFETLRRMIFPIIVIVLVFFVAMIVLEWGMDFTGSGRRRMGTDAGGSYAAEINGEKVPLEYYNRIYDNLYRSESQKNSADLTDDAVAQLRQQAWSELLQDRLLLQEAAKHNIVVTEQDIYSYLRSSPPQYIQSVKEFQTNGQFDYQKYMQAMADPKAASFWAQLEPALRSDLTKMKMQQMVVQATSVNEQDIRQAMLDQYEMVTVGMITVPLSTFVSTMATPSDNDLNAFHTAHKSDYEQGERAALDLVPITKEPSALDWEASQAKAKAIYDSIAAGADFATMAQQYSEDPGSAQQGGDLGWFTQGAMVAEFDKAVFGAKSGDLILPFRTQFGWHIIKHFGYRDDEEIPEGKTSKEKVHKAHAAHILIQTVQSQETQDLAFKKLSAIADAAREKSFEAAAKEQNLVPQTTPPFLKGYPIQTLGNSQSAHAFAFSHQPGEISGVLETPLMYFVARVSQRLPAGVAPLTEVKGRVINDIHQELARKIAVDTAAVIAQEIKSGMKPEDAAVKHRFIWQVSAPFARKGSLGGQIGQDPKAIGAAFSLTTPGQVVGPVECQIGAAVLVLVERKTPNLDQLNQQRDSVKQAVMYSRQSDLYSRWFDRLVKDSKIDNYVEQAAGAETGGQ